MFVKTTLRPEEIEVRKAALNAILSGVYPASKPISGLRKVVAVGPREVIAASAAFVKTAADKVSKYHGEISRRSDSTVDLAAEISKHPDFLWIRVKAIEADKENDNGDFFSKDEIRKAYRSFEGCPVFTNHENTDVEKAKGKVVMAEYDESDGSVYCTMYVDRAAHPHLARAIEEGYVTDVSMGTQVEFSNCSICDHRAVTADQYCDHVKLLKGRNYNGRKVFERNFGLKFIEISVVTDGACQDCTIREILDPADYIAQASTIQKAAASIQTSVKTGRAIDRQEAAAVVERIKTLGAITALARKDGQSNDDIIQEAIVASAVAIRDSVRSFRIAMMTKDGGQNEIQKLNQAMDLLEDVTRTMLDQRQFIDLEFMQKVAEVLAELQHVTDELVDQGYGSVGNQQGSVDVLPPMPGEQKEEAPMAANPTVSGTTPAGVGTVTEPTATAATSSRTLLSSLVQELHRRAANISEEQKSFRGGNDTVDKFQQTIQKLARIWENPSVRKFKTEVSDPDGKLRVALGEEDILGSLNGERIASIKIASLDPEIKKALDENPSAILGEMLKALEANVSSRMTKQAEKAPVNGKEQIQQTMESQLREQHTPLHPRQDKIRERTTEGQLNEDWPGYDYHTRKDDARTNTTEKQLREGREGYENFKRQESPREEVMEGQLRDTGIKGNQTPATSDQAWAAGVTDQKQQIHEGQLEDWRKSDKGHNPLHHITEKQLREDLGDPLGRRLASVSSKEEARTAISSAFKALAKTARATGATPGELIEAVSDFGVNPENTLRAVKVAAKFDTAEGAKQRETMLRRAAFHGSPRNASMSEVCTFLLGSLSDCGLEGNLGVKTLSEVASTKTASKKIEEAIKSLDEEAKVTTAAASRDLIKEALADESEAVSVVLAKEDVPANASDKEAFAKAAFEVATKEASVRGIRVTEQVHVKENADGEVEVSMYGVREASKPEPKAPAKEDLQKRSENRKAMVAEAQMPGGGGMAGAPGGDPMGGAGAGGQGAMGPGAPGAGPAAEPAPVSNLGGDLEDPMGGEEDGEGGEALPPGSFCPVCKSDDVDMNGGKFQCNNCGADGDIEVEMHIRNWPDTIQEKGPGKGGEEGGMGMGDELGLGDMEGGEGMEMEGAPGLPQVGVAAFIRIRPEMIKKAGNQPIGSVCPYCASGNVRTASKDGVVRAKCNDCQGDYTAELMVDTNNPSHAIAKIAWIDTGITKIASKEREQMNKLANKKSSLDVALKAKNLTAKFARADLPGKASIIADLHDEGLLD